MENSRRQFMLSGAALASALGTGRVYAQATPGEEMARPAMAYEGSKASGKLNIVNLFELEPQAEKILPAGGFGYISGGSGSNWTTSQPLADGDHGNRHTGG